jgi:ankyrin repeat protein
VSRKAYLCLAILCVNVYAIGAWITRPREKPVPLEIQLMDAAEAGDLKKVKDLIRRRAPINRPGEGSMALILALDTGRSETAKALLDAGADVNSIDSDRRTALMHAVTSGRPRLVRLMLERGANVHWRDLDGQNALMAAVHVYNIPAAQLLLAKGADPWAKDVFGKTPLTLAHRNRRMGRSRMFFLMKAAVEQRRAKAKAAKAKALAKDRQTERAGKGEG